ncbi:peptidyl-prolyl cis-trans isomerase [Dysgonomonas sp. ZJ279]|uniref:peptidyl-prolyl cis-trans isomerase n=1 Tax=Dysgonomonas sp. ZJ279 TaxID=2709796 RepID=UPI0013EC92CC|nr:peptidyl-prolyl cis-trans isomerase [Dysgonomonas sp. ZJ279]
MTKNRIYITIIFIFFIAYSCKQSGIGDVDASKQPIVTVQNNTLYKADLDDALPKKLSAEDSAATAQAYIKTWVNDQLMYDKAKQNILNKATIDELVEDYRKSLITNSYQEQLFKERFSRISSDSELKAYYEENKEMFKLEGSIIKGLYLKIPAGSPQLNNFKKWYKQTTDAAIENIEKNTLQNAVNYEYFYDRWVSFDDVMDNIPLLVTDRDQFLKTNKSIEVSDSSFVYLLNIKEYKLTGSEAPYEYIKGQLSDIFKEKRRASYLEEIQKDLYDKAISNNEIKFYDK